MPSTYTTNLGLEKPATGEQGGVWGVTANNDYDFIDQSTDGSLTIALSASSFNLNTLQGAASQGRSKVIVFTGTLLATSTVNITPNTAQKIYFVTNATQGGFNIVFQQGAGSFFTLQPNCSAMIYCDGLGSAASVNGALYNAQFGSVLITGQLTTSGALNFSQAATFSGPATFNGPVTIAQLATVAGALVVNTVGSPAAPYDLYYRAPGIGALTPLAIGAPGQVLGVNSVGQPAWGTVSLGIGSAIPGAFAYGVLYASAAGAMAQDANLNWVPGTGLGIGLQPGRTLHIGGALQPQVWLDSLAATTRGVFWATSGVPRWALNCPPAAETGGNVASNLGFASYSDSGAQLGWALMLFRATGHVSVGTSTDGGCQLFVQNATPGQAAMIVRGAAGQAQPLQVWQNSAGVALASIDQNGVLTSAGSGGSYLSLNSQGRLNLWGTVPGAPWGTIHIGPEPSFPQQAASLCMETSVSGPTALPVNVVRLYYRNQQFVIQFYYNGTQYFASLPLQPNPGSAVTWYISPTPI